MDELKFAIQDETVLGTRIKVVGVGGGGGNAVARMMAEGVVIERNGREVRIRARRGVVVAAGGFERNDEMRQRYQQHPVASAWAHATAL